MSVGKLNQRREIKSHASLCKWISPQKPMKRCRVFFSKIFYANKFDLSEGWEVFTLFREFLPEKRLPIRFQPSEPQAPNIGRRIYAHSLFKQPFKGCSMLRVFVDMSRAEIQYVGISPEMFFSASHTNFSRWILVCFFFLLTIVTHLLTCWPIYSSSRYTGQHKNQLLLGHSGLATKSLHNRCTSAMIHLQIRYWQALEDLVCM